MEKDERTPHAVLYDGYNDHYLVQCLGDDFTNCSFIRRSNTVPVGAAGNTLHCLTPLMYLQSERGTENAHKVIP